MLDLSIIILNYKTKELTESCLLSLQKQYEEELEKEKFEIVLVDNNSEDGSFDYLQKLEKEIPGLKVIQSGENLGFSNGNNFAAKSAKGKFFLFLNSDTEVTDRGFVGMVEYLNLNPNIGILGGKLVFPNNTRQRSAGKFYTLPYLFLMLLGFERFNLLRKSPTRISKVDWVSGACLMIRKEIFEKLGGFDAKIFMYMEDLKLSWDAKKSGFSTYFYPEVRVIHKERGSSNKTFAILNIYKGILHFYKKEKPSWQLLLAKLLLNLKAIFSIIVGSLTFNKNLVERYQSARQVIK